MKNIELANNGNIVVEIDTSIYNDSIISKTLYWLTPNFSICRNNNSDSSIQTIVFSSKTPLTDADLDNLRSTLSTSLIDYKNRDIIHQETKELRTILYAKAFANNDDFVEFDFDN